MTTRVVDELLIVRIKPPVMVNNGRSYRLVIAFILPSDLMVKKDSKEQYCFNTKFILKYALSHETIMMVCYFMRPIFY